jgi:hypothetical protein
MRIADFVITAAVVAGLSAPAMAQEGSGQAIQSPATAPSPAAATGRNQAVNYTNYPNSDRWVASAFVGTNFGTGFHNNLLDITTEGNTNTSINFGGEVAYLWGGHIGVEGLAEFSPSFDINDVLLENHPMINTYMANAIATSHFGSEHQFMPYFSGGIGAVQMRSTIFVIDPVTLNELGTLKETGSRFGGDVGGGLMGFAGKWGFRGDVRYYRASSNNNLDLTDLGTGNVFTQGVLSGLNFWKANVGVAYRW